MSSSMPNKELHSKAFVSIGVSVESARWSGGNSNQTSVSRKFEVSFAERIADPSGLFSESSKANANHFGICVGLSLADILWNAIQHDIPCPEKAMMSARSAFFDRVDEIVDHLDMVDKAERMDLDENREDA